MTDTKHSLIQLIKEYSRDFAFLALDNDRCRLIMLFPFTPFEPEEEKFFIDAYYLCSNASYHRQKELAVRINADFGMQAIVSEENINLKQAASDAGLCSYGFFNTLSYNSEYGSYFYIGSMIISHNGALDLDNCQSMGVINNGWECYSHIKKQHNSSICKSCKRCIAACPSGALGENGGIAVDKCIRFHMDNAFKDSPHLALKAKNCVYGCHFCQSACPINSHIARLPYPIELHDLAKNIMEEQSLKKLKSLLGKNVVKKELFERLVANAKAQNKH